MAKGAYIGFNGIARKITTGYIGINGTARKIKKAYVGVNGIAREWYSSGKKLSSCAVGEIVQLPENGTNVEYLVVHQGLPGSLYDESCNGTWLVRNKVITKRAWNSEGNYYANSDIHAYLTGVFLPRLGSTLREQINLAKIPYCTGGSKTIKSGANGLETRVFALSAYEVGFTTSTDSDIPRDGTMLSYFTATDNTRRVAKYNSTACTWWLRSPSTGDTNNVFHVGADGTCKYTAFTNSAIGCRPALIMNGDTLLNPETNTVLS